MPWRQQVQGVAWHPTNNCIITQSSDRSLKVYEQRKKAYMCVATTTKTQLPETAGAAAEGGATVAGSAGSAVERGNEGGMDTARDDDAAAADAATQITHSDAGAESAPMSPTASITTPATVPTLLAEGKAGTPAPLEATAAVAAKPKMRSERLFVDETRTAFFRRLTFTPDGTMFIAAAGRHVLEDGKCTLLLLEKHACTHADADADTDRTSTQADRPPAPLPPHPLTLSCFFCVYC